LGIAARTGRAKNLWIQAARLIEKPCAIDPKTAGENDITYSSNKVYFFHLSQGHFRDTLTLCFLLAV
jgi:hypothetical protein